jgi:hypothetical protein
MDVLLFPFLLFLLLPFLPFSAFEETRIGPLLVGRSEGGLDGRLGELAVLVDARSDTRSDGTLDGRIDGEDDGAPATGKTFLEAALLNNIEDEREQAEAEGGLY